MPAATSQRRLLVATAIAMYGLVFGAFVVIEVPGLGLGHFFYIPIALLALACGTRVGFAAGALAAGLYALATFVTPDVPSGDVLTAATAIRLVTYCSSGALIGWFAGKHHDHVEQLRELAARDFLTGLLNTRVFDEALAHRCADDDRFVLLLGDMDNLKEINDAHGHTEGNRELRRLADALAALLGPGDQLARVGGDEFALLTPAGVGAAPELCARLQRLLAAQSLEVSFGWSARPADGEAPLELFRKADDRLYAAKLIRRNRRAVMGLATAARS